MSVSAALLLERRLCSGEAYPSFNLLQCASTALTNGRAYFHFLAAAADGNGTGGCTVCNGGPESFFPDSFPLFNIYASVAPPFQPPRPPGSPSPSSPP
eukprot:3937735-Pleurochrysis_carterae.AAC.2